MKFVKSISLFFIYPAVLLAVGFGSGVMYRDYFSPGNSGAERPGLENGAREEAGAERPDTENTGEADTRLGTGRPENRHNPDWENGASVQVSSGSDRLNCDTEYVLEETDILEQTVVETRWRLPEQYIGLNREQFLSVMDAYEASPPLSELERGFVSLEVLAFSKEKVVVQMNYEYIRPTSSFYLKVENNYIVVYLDDGITRYMDTEIFLPELPEEMQQDIIQVMYIPDEESLYDFLENYSS